MQKSILLYLSKLEGFKTAIKNCHWAAKSMNAHEFMDSLEDIVSDHQDLVAEIVQGAYNTKIKVNDFKPRPYKISTFTKLVSDIYNAADKFYATIQGNKRFIGLRSVMEDFMGKMQQQAYLNAMCTENKKDVKKLIKENMAKKIVKLTESQLQQVISDSVYKILNEVREMDYMDYHFIRGKKKSQIDLDQLAKYIEQKLSKERYKADEFDGTYFRYYTMVFEDFEKITHLLSMNEPRFEQMKMQVLKNLIESLKQFFRICKQDSMEGDLLTKVYQELNEFSSNPSDVKKWVEIVKKFLGLDLTRLPYDMGRSYDRF